MRTADILKEICKKHNLEIIDVNDYEQPKFKREFDELTKGRKVSIGFVSNKFNKLNKG